MLAWLTRMTDTSRTFKAPREFMASRAATLDELDTEPMPLAELDSAMLLNGQAEIDLAFFAWLVESPVDARAPLGKREQRALQNLERMVGDPRAHAALLPRTSAVIPRLLSRLRDETSSLRDLSQYVSRDVNLVAEVIRMANSVYFAREQAVVELKHAIQVLGSDGLASAIARVVVRPVMDARGGDPAARRARRLWDHTDKKTQLCAALARNDGINSFEAYLLGLVHDAAWNAVLRALDGSEGVQPWRIGSELVAALGPWRDRLFALIAQQWQLDPHLVALAGEVGRHGLGPGAGPEVLGLYAGDRLASLLCCYSPARAAALAEDMLVATGEPVRTCYATFTPARD